MVLVRHYGESVDPTEILNNLALDSQTKTVEAAPEATTKKGSVDAGDANGQHVQSKERATPTIIQDFVDSYMRYVPSAYPSSAYCYSGYENSMTGDWGNEYSRCMSQDGVEMTHGVYGDNGSLLYLHGYGYGYGYAPFNTNSYLNSNGSLGRGVLPGDFPGYQDPRFGYDEMRPWLDGSVFPDGLARPAASSSFPSTVSHIYGFQSGGNQNLRFIPTNIMGSHSQMPATGMTTPGFMNKYYPPSSHSQTPATGMTTQCGAGFGLHGYDSRTNRRVYYPVDNKYKPRGRGNMYYGYGTENINGLNELNRGPRARGFKNQKGFIPITLAVKGQELLNSAVNEEKALTGAPNKDEYNKADFAEKCADAKFFIIKSYGEDDVHKSVKYGVWASTANGNKKLDAGYKEAREKAGGCPVFLLFSVNTSGQFIGLAEMTGPLDFNKSAEYWKQDKWNGCFPVKWHIVKDAPNSLLKHITLENNGNQPVTNSRDTQEVKFEQGLKLIKILKDHLSKTCILDDFGFYEGRQKKIQEKRAKQQIHKQVWDSKPTANAAVADTNENDREGANGKVSLPEPLEDDASIVSSLNDSYSDEFEEFESDEEDDDEDDDDWGKWSVGELTEEGTGPAWDFCNLSKEKDNSHSDKLRQLMDSGPLLREEDERYTVHVYGYYRKSREYGGYGIIVLDGSRKPIGAYYGFSKGGSYLYYLLFGMRRGLEIADERGLYQVQWSINSLRAVVHFNSLFRYPCMLRSYFHSKRDVADINFCRRCLRNQMCLTTASFELLIPVIEEFIKLQFKIGFHYREVCTEVRSDAAYYLAKCGAEALEEKMKLGASSDTVQEVEMEMDELQRYLKEKRLPAYTDNHII